ncbi:MAG: nickel/cobalt transporter [Desulfococcaceae bacterium]
MMRLLYLLVVFAALGPWTVPAEAGNPFTSKPTARPEAPEPMFKSRFLIQIIHWQHQLKENMSALIREAKEENRFQPLILLALSAFAYGVIHAAGPGHGKFVAVSYAASHHPTVPGGLLFALFIAGFHGISGVAGVLGLRYIIQRGVGETLASVTSVTQVVSFGLIALLGTALVLKNGYALVFASGSRTRPSPATPSKRSLLPWALAIGLVPCPAVVMVTLFCMSMEVMTLGLVLAACITLGMAATLAGVITAFLLGKTGALNLVPEKRAKTIEGAIGLLSGAAVTAFGTLFLLTSLSGAI